MHHATSFPLHYCKQETFDRQWCPLKMPWKALTLIALLEGCSLGVYFAWFSVQREIKEIKWNMPCLLCMPTQHTRQYHRIHFFMRYEQKALYKLMV